MKEEEKALADLIGEFLKVYAPIRVDNITGKADIWLSPNDITGFEFVVMSYKHDGPKFPIFSVDGGGTLDKKVMLWFVHSSGLRASVRIDKKYLKGVGESG